MKETEDVLVEALVGDRTWPRILNPSTAVREVLAALRSLPVEARMEAMGMRRAAPLWLHRVDGDLIRGGMDHPEPDWLPLWVEAT